jgi:hypothetical protein
MLQKLSEQGREQTVGSFWVVFHFWKLCDLPSRCQICQVKECNIKNRRIMISEVANMSRISFMSRAFCNTCQDTQETLERWQQSLAIIEEAYTRWNFSRYTKKALTKFECAHVRENSSWGTGERKYLVRQCKVCTSHKMQIEITYIC